MGMRTASCGDALGRGNLLACRARRGQQGGAPDGRGDALPRRSAHLTPSGGPLSVPAVAHTHCPASPLERTTLCPVGSPVLLPAVPCPSTLPPHGPAPPRRPSLPLAPSCCAGQCCACRILPHCPASPLGRVTVRPPGRPGLLPAMARTSTLPHCSPPRPRGPPPAWRSRDAVPVASCHTARPHPRGPSPPHLAMSCCSM